MGKISGQNSDNQSLQKNKNDQQTIFVKITFIVLGISSLIGWNCVLASFPYFNSTYGSRVFTYFPIPLNVANCVFGLVMPVLATKLSNLFRIVVCQAILSLILVALPIIDQVSDPDTGYTITLVITFFIGMFQSISQNTMIAMAAQIGGIVNSLYWIATGLSGLIMAILCIMCFLIFPHDEQGSYYSSILFMTIGSLISILSIVLTYILIVKKNFMQKQEETTTNNSNENNNIDYNQFVNETQVSEQYTDNLQNLSQEKENQDQTFLEKIKEALSYSKLIPFMIFIIYLLTFTLFPAIMESDVQFTTKFLNKDDQLWGQQYLNLTYQISDVLGKSISSFEIFHRKPLQYTLVILRIIVFVPTSLLVAYQQGSVFTSNWFPFVNMFLMASTNGFCTGGLMSLNSKSGKNNLRISEIIGFIGAFGLTFGIACGTFLALLIDPKTQIIYYYNN